MTAETPSELWRGCVIRNDNYRTALTIYLSPKQEQANFMQWVLRHCLVPSLTRGVGGVYVWIPKKDRRWIAEMVLRHVSEAQKSGVSDWVKRCMERWARELTDTSVVMLDSGGSSAAVRGAVEDTKEEPVNPRKRQWSCVEIDGGEEEDEDDFRGGAEDEDAAFLRRLLKEGSMIVDFDERVSAPPGSPVYGCGGCGGGSASSSQSGLSEGAQERYESERASIGVPDGEGETFKAWEGDLEGLLGDVASLNEQNKELWREFQGKLEALKAHMHDQHRDEVERLREERKSYEARKTEYQAKLESGGHAILTRVSLMNSIGDCTMKIAENEANAARLTRELRDEFCEGQGYLLAHLRFSEWMAAREKLSAHVPWRFNLALLEEFSVKEDIGVDSEEYLEIVRLAKEKCVEYESAFQEMWRRVICLMYDRVTWKPLPRPLGWEVAEELLRCCSAIAMSLTKMMAPLRSCVNGVHAMGEDLFENGGKTVSLKVQPRRFKAYEVFPGCPRLYVDTVQKLEVIRFKNGGLMKLLDEKVVSANLARDLLCDVVELQGLLLEYGKGEKCDEEEAYALVGVELCYGH